MTHRISRIARFAGIAVAFAALAAPAQANVICNTHCGHGVGDPHLQNLNGLAFDFQADGIFTLAQTDASFVVQTRQTSGIPNRPLVALNRAVAMRMNEHHLAICTKPQRLIVDGQEEQLDDGGSLQLTGVLVQHQGFEYTFTRSDGYSVTVQPVSAGSQQYLNIWVDLGADGTTNTTGLIGNGGGLGGPTDLVTSGGTVLQQPISFADLYNLFGDSWRVSPQNSLVQEMCSKKKNKTSNPSAPFLAKDLDPEVYAQAKAICRKAGVHDKELLQQCILDVAVLGRKAAKVFAQKKDARGTLPGAGR